MDVSTIGPFEPEGFCLAQVLSLQFVLREVGNLLGLAFKHYRELVLVDTLF